MARLLKELEKELMDLPHKDRAELAHRLLVSLDDEEEQLSFAEVEALWIEEIQRREREVESGKAVWLSYDEVMAGLKKKL
jgi:putative addiction module component (TIGR02574 family)